MSIKAAFVDPLQGARPGDRLAGTVPLARMSRLGEDLYAPAGDLAYTLELALDKRGRTTLQGQVSGHVTLRCQRCLGGLAWSVDTGFRLAVVASATEAESLESGYEPLVRCDEPLSLVSVLEDEIILAMPSARVHPGSVCQAPSFAAGDTPAPEPPLHRPFEALADFKKLQPNR